MSDVGSPGKGELALDQFVRFVVSRGRELHWLTGAGVSLSAGVPTASDLIYDFKAVLYAQRERVEKRAIDLRNPDVRTRLDRYFAAHGEFPPPGASDEYATFFEAAYPDRGDRQRRIQKMLDEAPSGPVHGHIVLAGLWRLELLHTIWTTTFDLVMEEAAVKVSGKAGWLTVSDLDAPGRARTGLSDPARPLLVKMHGDFRSERLNNTKSELRDADNALRRVLTEAMRTRGLVVVGYSGRDDSVMESLTRSLESEQAFSAGLYWVSRSGSPLLPRVIDLLNDAARRGIAARVVECGGFEELMESVRLLLEPDDKLAALFDQFQPR